MVEVRQACLFAAFEVERCGFTCFTVSCSHGEEFFMVLVTEPSSTVYMPMFFYLHRKWESRDLEVGSILRDDCSCSHAF